MIYNTDRIKSVTINLGIQGENLANKVEIDVSSMLSKWPDGSVALLVQRSGESAPYIPLTKVKDGILEWDVTATDTAISGYGKIEIRCMAGDVIKKSVTGTTYTAKSMTEDPIDPPDPSQSWVEEVLSAGEQAKKEADRAEAAADGLAAVGAEAKTVSHEDPASVEVVDLPEGGRKIIYGIPQGAPGQKGADGITPVIGENGNWFLGEEDTGKPSRGAQGEPGKDGVQGPKGDPGKDAPQIDDTKITSSNPWSSKKIMDAIGIKPVQSGELVHIDDSSDLQLWGLKIFGKTTQDGNPTPETPVPLVSVGDSGNVKTTVIRSSVWDGQWKNGYYNASNGEYISVSSAWCSKNPIPVVPSQSYFGRYFPNNVENPLFIQMYDRNMGFIKQITVNNSTFKTESNCYFINFNVKVGSEPYNNDLVINFGTSAIPWEPYQSQTITIPTPDGLPGIQVDSGGTYTDSTGKQWVCNSIEGGNGKWEYVKRVYKYTCTGDEDVGEYTMGDGNKRYNVVMPGDNFPLQTLKKQLSNRFKYSEKLLGGTNTIDGSFYVAKVGSSIWILLRLDSIKTKDELREYLKNNECTFIYALISFVNTPITDPELIAKLDALHTYEGATNLFTTDNAGLSVIYIADPHMYIDKKLGSLTERLFALETATVSKV